jgi:hypothetical protein
MTAMRLHTHQYSETKGMTATDIRLDALERTVKRQRFILVAGVLLFVVAWSAGAMSKPQAESLKGKELLIEDENGKTIAKLGSNGSGGVEFVLSPDLEKAERAIRLSIDNEGSIVTSAFDGASSRTASSAKGAATLLTSKDGNQIETYAAAITSFRFGHKDEKFARLMMTSDPKMWPTIILREANDTIRWQSPKAGR